MRAAKYTLAAIAFSMALFFVIAPVEWNEKEQAYEIRNSQIIMQPVCRVYDYMGRSEAAADWSYFVAKIEVINPTLKDGAVGIKRICYAKKYPANATWEEEILQAEACKLRRLSIYNLKNFPMTANGLFTDQLYSIESKNHCRLSLALYLPNGSLWERLKFFLASPYISNIFSKNLKNIKTILENGAAI